MKKLETTTQADILEIATEQGLRTVQITTGSNGYPKGLGDYGVIGFKNIEDAKDFAETHNGELSHFETKRGWDFWETISPAYTPYTFQDYLNTLGDDYNIATINDENYIERLQLIVGKFEGDFDELEKEIISIKEIQQEIDNAEENQIVILKNGYYYETVDDTLMEISHDTKTYAIGVLIQ